MDWSRGKEHFTFDVLRTRLHLFSLFTFSRICHPLFSPRRRKPSIPPRMERQRTERRRLAGQLVTVLCCILQCIEDGSHSNGGWRSEHLFLRRCSCTFSVSRTDDDADTSASGSLGTPVSRSRAAAAETAASQDDSGQFARYDQQGVAVVVVKEAKESEHERDGQLGWCW